MTSEPSESQPVADSSPVSVPVPEAISEPELTPELVEEEAIRGDFMLRWAVTLLALLMGWTVVTDTLTLVRIRSGEYMLAHGFLPPRTDVFSVSAGDRPWINLAWLGDVVLAGVYQVGGERLLSILAAVLAAVTLRCVVQTSHTGVSTWWGSIAATIGVVACFPHLTPNSIWTLCGLAITCRLLHHWDEEPAQRSLWWLVPCFWVWSNVDRFAFVGLGVLLLWALGRTATNLGLQGTRKVSPLTWWLPVLASALVVLVHPWHYHVWLAAWDAFAIEFPEVRRYVTVTDDFTWQWQAMTATQFWNMLDVFVVFGFIIAGIALLMMVLNLQEVPFEHLLWFFGLNGLAVASAYFIPAAALVNVVIANLNGQAWYRRTFSMKYTVHAGALAFSRGGRALTVLAVFLLAFLTINGQLMGPSGRRLGMGLSASLSSNIESYRSVLDIGPDVDEPRPFNFRVEQGDLLIWLKETPFVDRRLTLYARGPENLLELHRKTRLAIQMRIDNNPDQERPEVWQDTFRTYSLTHAMPRLSGAVPDYATFSSLLGMPQHWYPVSIGAATASFYWRNESVPAVKAFIENGEGIDLVRDAFRTQPGESPAFELNWPREISFTDRYLLLPSPSIPNGIQLARHYDVLLQTGQFTEVGQLALAYLAIRHARAGLSDNPNVAEGWRILSRSYLALHNLENFLLQSNGSQATTSIRLRQATTALYLARLCEPGRPEVEFELANLCYEIGLADMSVEHFRTLESLTGRLSLLPEDHPDYEQQAAPVAQFLQNISEQITEVRSQVRERLDDGSNRLELVSGLYQGGFHRMAADLMEEDLTLVEQSLDSRMVWAHLLFNTGQIERSWEQLERLNPAFERPGQTTLENLETWSDAAALANLTAGGAVRAIDVWERAAERRLQSIVTNLIAFPSVFDKPPELHGVQGLFRLNQIGTARFQELETWALRKWYIATVELELGRTSDAAQRLREILDTFPETTLRPLIALHLTLITGENFELIPPVATGGIVLPESQLESEDVPPPPPLPGEID